MSNSPTAVTRRQFVRRAASAAAASSAFSLFTIAGTKASGRVLGANDTIRLGVAGINGRGGSHIGGFGKMDGVQITYLIDPDTRLFKSRGENVKKLSGSLPKTVADIREALADKNLDAVSVATCNHWHSLITIWACEAGKDVYVEKPLSHNVHEGRIALGMARKHDRIVQHGTQSRSSQGTAQEVAAARSGRFGKLVLSKGYCHKARWSIGTKPIAPPPAGLDFNLWLGPAPEQPYHDNLVHYNWHWFWDFGNGDIGNQGVHQMDIARWAIAGPALPKSVVSFGGRFGYEDQGQTPNTLMTVFDYGDVKLAFETCGLVQGKSKAKSRVDNEFFTTDGRIAGGKFHPNGGGDPVSLKDVPTEIRREEHFANFITAVRSRKIEDLNADVEVAHYSSALCHLGNIAYRVGKECPYEQAKEELKPNTAAMDLFESMTHNLAKGNDIAVDKLAVRVSPTLAFDAAQERFVDNNAANELLTRKYREPFVVPSNA
ncbi:MAG: gfo/Idh/MocA family oxidoreductase [Planctomycetota bacterium]|nr:MAG: gfo/Idh/MocA family oxidoreductase [Planctomycetota bacterium]